MARIDFKVHDDGVISFYGEAVGELLTGEDGLAYVEFFKEHAPQPAELWFCGPNPPFYS